jgi:hypothetical protein
VQRVSLFAGIVVEYADNGVIDEDGGVTGLAGRRA